MEALAVLAILMLLYQVNMDNDLSKIRKRIEDIEQHLAKILEKLK